MKLLSEPLPGVYLLEPKLFTDHRGSFVKTFHAGDFAALGIAFAPTEEFFSSSHPQVVRGMHFQLPPQAHDKLVYCVHGRVLDVLVDLRRSSSHFGRFASAELSADNRLEFFIPAGVAHGFLSLEEDSVMVYKTTTVHSPAHDAGVRWDSFGFSWPVQDPVVSTRDRGFPSLADFNSPF